MRARMKAVVALVAALLAPMAAWGEAYTGTVADAVSAAQRSDYATALRGFRIFAKFGNALAQYNLGFMYANGLGVQQDHREAVRWYRLAAEQGNVAAHTGLGYMYDSGKGVPQDYREAVRWYRMAAAQGNPTGMMNLGGMYGKGEGVPQDYVRAHMWSNLAAAAGAGDNATSNRDAIARMMTPAQIAEAQRLARECLASNYKRCGEPAEVPPSTQR